MAMCTKRIVEISAVFASAAAVNIERKGSEIGVEDAAHSCFDASGDNRNIVPRNRKEGGLLRADFCLDLSH